MRYDTPPPPFLSQVRKVRRAEENKNVGNLLSDGRGLFKEKRAFFVTCSCSIKYVASAVCLH